MAQWSVEKVANLHICLIINKLVKMAEMTERHGHRSINKETIWPILTKYGHIGHISNRIVVKGVERADPSLRFVKK